MNPHQQRRNQTLTTGLGEDSPITLLQHLEEERGKMFTEAEYQEMRQTVIHELAHGARLRPFTLFTFLIVGLGLLGLFIVGWVTATGNTVKDMALSVVSGTALVAEGYFFWSCLRGIKQDALRSLESRLNELEQLLALNLISREEFDQIQSHILISRQNTQTI
jgi:hypothetical protein